MRSTIAETMQRREFCKRTVDWATASSLVLAAPGWSAAAPPTALSAGEATVDITPPKGTLMSGFHYSPGNERCVEGVRQSTAARALVLRSGDAEFAILSVDLLAISRQAARQIQQTVERQTGIPAAHVRVTATHSHSTPSGRFLRQWGGLPEAYLSSVRQKCVAAVASAQSDLTAAELYLGKSVAHGANFNRTRKSWKNEDQFTPDATDDERWLDRTVHVLHFDRSGSASNLLWYHFSAHPVCFTDRQASPDWPGKVAQLLNEQEGIAPSFLQGHIGDVNPGDGSPWLGDADKTAARLSEAILRGQSSARKVDFDRIAMHSREIQIPFDMNLHRQQMERYRNDPEGSSGGEYVDAAFARDWYRSAQQWDLQRKGLATDISVLALGDLAIMFHPSELFSYYGLRIREESPYADSILVGYADGMIGYLTDPASHEQREYASAVVPKILDLPPFTPTASRTFTEQAVTLLEEAHA